jgi:gamma-glutamylcyclotransferase (GGCT)/AIG2-like uncharacterized protein YtfP
MMPHSPDEARCVFVYGTLRRGGRNDILRYLPMPRYVGDATIPGALFDLGGYPGAVLSGPGRVVGEVYAIDAGVEAQLDLLEEVEPDDSGEYIKRELHVVVGTIDVACLVYEIHPDRVRGKPIIPRGDWFEICPRVS